AVRRITARNIPPPLEFAVTADAPRAATSAPVVRAVPIVVAAHLPPDPTRPDTARLLLAASSTPWPGRVTITDDATGAFIARLERAAALGELTAPLGSGPAAMWDRGNVLEVGLHAGHVASVDDGVALGGGNRIAVKTDSGGWEVIGFASAELVAPATYRLTRLLRGQGGTDVGTGTASAGARAVVLDESVWVVDIPAGWVGDTVTLRAYAGASDPAGTAIVVNLPLAPLLPLPPVHLCAQRLANGDVAIRWVRRSRADTQNWAPVEVPLDNVPEAYRVTILDGATVIRELEVTTPAATYAAADQAADFGALPPVFGFTVRQVSPVYGPGHPASGEFHD
ncbi:MAG TPA: hypothetical protein GYA10_16140, partial [Alphaproteobacteria bacterium]|nr:hypothetical protein [Alphaproteobacteria bacterium]